MLNQINPKVSVIIPCYNVEKYLRQCLDSVVNQTLKDIEIICVNDGSTDGTLDILKEYAQKDKRIKLIDQENQRQSIARRNAMKIATGEYIQNVDADDWIREDACELLYNYAKENNLDMLQFAAINFNQKKGILEDKGWYSFRWLPENFKKIFTYHDCKDFMSQICMAACLSFYSHDFLTNNNIFWVQKKCCYEDVLFTMQALLKAKRISIFQEYLYFRRWHNASTVNNLNTNFSDWLSIMELVLSVIQTTDSSLLPHYMDFYLNRTDLWYHRISFISKLKNLKGLLNIYEHCIKNYHIELPSKNRKTLELFLWLSPVRISRLLLKSHPSHHEKLPLFSINKSSEKNTVNEIHKVTCKFFGITLFKIRQESLLLKTKMKNGIRYFYLFSFLLIWKKNLFKKIQISQRLILCFDCLSDKNCEAIDSWTLFEYLQKKQIPSRYIVLKDNILVTKLKQKHHSFKDIIVLDSWQELLTKCHDDICKSKLILTSFGCGPTCNQTLQKLSYLKYIYLNHGVMLLKESAIQLCANNTYDYTLVPTTATKQLYQEKQLWQKKQIPVGLPRWDRLHHVKHASKNIFIFFTWRKKIKEVPFVLKNYKQQIFGFLTNPKLSNLLRKHQINLNIAPHHALIQNGGNLVLPDNVHLVSPTEISQIIGQTDLMITDYSSIMFDFMFLDIPVISYRFDADYPFLSEKDKLDAASAKSHDSELYNVFYDEDSVIQKIEYYINHNFELEPEYKKINDSLFWERENICQHLYDALQKLPPKKK